MWFLAYKFPGKLILLSFLAVNTTNISLKPFKIHMTPSELILFSSPWTLFVLWHRNWRPHPPVSSGGSSEPAWAARPSHGSSGFEVSSGSAPIGHLVSLSCSHSSLGSVSPGHDGSLTLLDSHGQQLLSDPLVPPFSLHVPRVIFCKSSVIV